MHDLAPVLSNMSIFSSQYGSGKYVLGRLLRVLTVQIKGDFKWTTLLQLEGLLDLPAPSFGFARFKSVGMCFVPPGNKQWSIAARVPVFPHQAEPGHYIYNHRVYKAWIDRWPSTAPHANNENAPEGDEDNDGQDLHARGRATRPHHYYTSDVEDDEADDEADEVEC